MESVLRDHRILPIKNHAMRRTLCKCSPKEVGYLSHLLHAPRAGQRGIPFCMFVTIIVSPVRRYAKLEEQERI